MSSLYLVAKMAGVKIAIKSHAVDSVIRVDDVVSIPKSSPLVAGLFAMRSRVLTLIDSQYNVTGTRAAVQSGAHAIVSEIGGFQYGFLVDGVDDVVLIDEDQFEASLKPADNWARITSTLANSDGEILTIIDPALLLKSSTWLAGKSAESGLSALTCH